MLFLSVIGIEDGYDGSFSVRLFNSAFVQSRLARSSGRRSMPGNQQQGVLSRINPQAGKLEPLAAANFLKSHPGATTGRVLVGPLA
jgi:hypothetical protein